MAQQEFPFFPRKRWPQAKVGEDVKTGFGLSALALGLFFASTVFVVFAAGFLAPRWARRWGPVRVARTGIVIALGGSIAVLIGKEDFFFFCVSLTVFLLGMGLVNPLATAIALSPFGKQAGAASALLGFLQMGCAAAAITIGTGLGLPAYAALGAILTTALAVSFLTFLAVE